MPEIHINLLIGFQSFQQATNKELLPFFDFCFTFRSTSTQTQNLNQLFVHQPVNIQSCSHFDGTKSVIDSMGAIVSLFDPPSVVDPFLGNHVRFMIMMLTPTSSIYLTCSHCGNVCLLTCVYLV